MAHQLMKLQFVTASTELNPNGSKVFILQDLFRKHNPAFLITPDQDGTQSNLRFHLLKCLICAYSR